VELQIRLPQLVGTHSLHCYVWSTRKWGCSLSHPANMHKCHCQPT